MNLDERIAVRANSEKFKIFKKWCKSAETTPAKIIREIIEAIPQERVKVKQNIEIKNQKLKELYIEKD